MKNSLPRAVFSRPPEGRAEKNLEKILFMD
jgi:hypothetical protein